jgi:hypothetical protein
LGRRQHATGAKGPQPGGSNGPKASLRRNWPVSSIQLPVTAATYYKAETRRLKAESRPVQWLRLGSILFAIGMIVLSFVFNLPRLTILRWYSNESGDLAA